MYRWKARPPTGRNHAPVFTASAAVTADQYATVSIPLTAADRDGDRLAFYATDLPAATARSSRWGWAGR
jgi:glucosylceramidase